MLLTLVYPSINPLHKGKLTFLPPLLFHLFLFAFIQRKMLVSLSINPLSQDKTIFLHYLSPVFACFYPTQDDASSGCGSNALDCHFSFLSYEHQSGWDSTSRNTDIDFCVYFLQLGKVIAEIKKKTTPIMKQHSMCLPATINEHWPCQYLFMGQPAETFLFKYDTIQAPSSRFFGI
jgi:hypothetical protein